jgi:hypothetical protein
MLSLLLLLLPTAAFADGPAPAPAPQVEKKATVFNAWLGYGASTVTYEDEDLKTDDFSLGAEYGIRFLGDLAVVGSLQISSYHFLDDVDFPARGGWSTGAALQYAGPVRVSVGAEAGIHTGYPWDVETIDDLENESFFMTAEFVRVHVPLMPVGSYRLGVSAQVQARQYGDDTSSVSAVVGVSISN